jgi:hypothetical protein
LCWNPSLVREGNDWKCALKCRVWSCTVRFLKCALKCRVRPSFQLQL